MYTYHLNMRIQATHTGSTPQILDHELPLISILVDNELVFLTRDEIINMNDMK